MGNELNSAKIGFLARICGDAGDVSFFGYCSRLRVDMQPFLKILFGIIVLVMPEEIM